MSLILKKKNVYFILLHTTLNFMMKCSKNNGHLPKINENTFCFYSYFFNVSEIMLIMCQDTHTHTHTRTYTHIFTDNDK